MKRKIVWGVLAGIIAVCVGAQADVYSNVYFWSRGLASDLDGDGQLDANEGRDSLNRTTFNYTVRNAGTTAEQPPISYTNEWAHLPYRGTTNFVHSLYLPQSVTVTDPETGAGYGYPCTIEIPNDVISELTNQEKANYTIFLRFRPDIDQPHPSYAWLAHFGHNSGKDPVTEVPYKSGIMIGFTGIGPTVHHYGGDTGPYYTNITAQLCIYYGGTSWSPANTRVNLNNWNDLILSCEGHKIRLLLSRDLYIDGFENNYNNSSISIWPTFYQEKTVDESYNLRPYGTTANLRIGAEATASTRQEYKSPASSNGNQWKAFRGAIQTIALWTNALTEAQMREAAAWPRMDKWRLGIEDGKANEFAAAAESAVVDVEGDIWAVPPLEAGKSVTVRFPLDASGDAKMNQFVRIKGIENATPAVLKVAVNGTICEGTKTVQAGRFTRWFVPAELLKANATNEVTITRADSGSTPFRMDVVAFGGSVQYCEDNGNTHENHGEGRYQNTQYYDLIGGNWFEGNRAIFGGRGNSTTTYTNQLVRFSLPEDVQGLNLDYRLTLRTAGNHRIDVFFNDTQLADGVVADRAGGLSYDISADLFKTVNEVNVVNVSDWANGAYIGIDFIRLSVQKPPTGMIMILR